MIKPRKATFESDAPNARNKQIAFYVSAEAEHQIKMFAVDSGFKSTSALMVFMVERLIHDHWSPWGFLRTGTQLQKHTEKHVGALQTRIDWGLFTRETLPLPEYGVPAAEWRKMLAEIKKEITAEIEKNKQQTKDKKP